jgi:1-acyl-sn-glycerol-3-phosphate acyltransferase
VIVVGKENIPHDKPVLFAPNHQNALMDALAVLFTQNEETVFLARSDIFSGKILSKILFSMKILPVFRIRDGKEKLKLNELIFQKTVDIIVLKKKIAIFPEAQHIDKRHLRILKKGIQRVAFQAEESHGFSLDVKIVPVGIYYSNYWNFRSVLMVRYGKPISVSDFYDLYRENQQKAMNALGDEMSAKIKGLIIHISDLSQYDTFETLREICDVPTMIKAGIRKFTPEKKFEADKKVIAAVERFAAEKPTDFQKLSSKTIQYQQLLKKTKMEDLYVEKRHHLLNFVFRFLALLAGFPIFLYGGLNNIFPALLPKLVTNKLKDRQFESSVVFVLGLILFPIFYLIQTTICQLLFHHWWFSLIYAVSLPVMGLISFMYYRYFRKFRFTARFVFNKKNPDFINLIKIRNEILEQTDKIITISEIKN